MVDAPWVLQRGETALLLTGPGQGEAVRRWLSGYVFYNDQVKFEAAEALAQFALYGPHAGGILGAVVPGAEALAPGQLIECDGLLALRGHPFETGFTLLVPAERGAAAWAQLGAAGAVAGDAGAYQSLRVALGEPEAGREISEGYIPLEANLWSAVSFSKGCYIGQEIIARMESRGKLARRLVGLRLSAPVPEGAEVFAGEALVGQVTSTAVLPETGPVALAFLKSAAAEAGARVRVGEAHGVVTELPLL
jgi:aminomethyltransferase